MRSKVSTSQEISLRVHLAPTSGLVAMKQFVKAQYIQGILHNKELYIYRSSTLPIHVPNGQTLLYILVYSGTSNYDHNPFRANARSSSHKISEEVKENEIIRSGTAKCHHQTDFRTFLMARA